MPAGSLPALPCHQLWFACLLVVLLCGCGGGSSTGFDPGATAPPNTALECTGQCAGPDSFLRATEVGRIIAQAVGEAQAIGQPATIAIVDRVGNVLGVFKMDGAADFVTISSGLAISGGLENINVIPAELAAISKAITGAYLSSEGNAFSTRTASQIVQEHFNPGEIGQPGGPLFGVQFSQLPCSDLSNRFITGTGPGPHRSPLGLSADPGGLPLYKEGVPVGGIGVVADGFYSLDLMLTDVDYDIDEAIALAASFGFGAPLDRRASRIAVDGKTLRFIDLDSSQLLSDPAAAGSFASIDNNAGSLLLVTAYFSGSLLDGTAFGQPHSGVRPDLMDYPGLDAFVLVDTVNVERYRPRAGSDGPDALSSDEVRVLMQQALAVANRSRAQIRRPLGSQARVTIAIVDTNGLVLALARNRDAPVFGTDVSLQKARTAAFFSGDYAAADLQSAPNTIYLNPDATASGVQIAMADYLSSARTFLGSDSSLSDGAIAFSDRAGGNLSRPYFPDGVVSNANGPFGKPIGQWSPFSVGLQLDLVMNGIIQHVVHVLSGGMAVDIGKNCTAINRLANGIQIFPGSVPIYRGSNLVGGIGISGDGVDQDDMVAFLGLHQAGQILGTINNAPPGMRADQLTPQGQRLRFIQCPQAPFLNSNEQNVCAGK